MKENYSTPLLTILAIRAGVMCQNSGNVSANASGENMSTRNEEW